MLENFFIQLSLWNGKKILHFGDIFTQQSQPLLHCSFKGIFFRTFVVCWFKIYTFTATHPI